jgi:tetratricopeptide (TPR) repeat protein
MVLLSCCLAIAAFSNEGIAQTRPREKIRDALRAGRDTRQSQALTDEAIALYKQGKNALAAQKVEQALRLDGRNDRALALSAELALKAGRHEVARLQASRALFINNRNPRAHLVLGKILLVDGKPLAGFDHIRKAAALLPEGAEKDEARAAVLRLKTQHPDWFKPASTPSMAAGVPAPLPAQVATVENEDQMVAKPRLAVFTFENIGIVDTTMKWGETISEMLTTSLINSNRFKVIERTQLDKVLQEQALGQSGALDSETAVVVGKIMGLEAVVVGSVSKLATVYEADVRILNVENGEAVAAANASTASANQLRSVAESLASALAGHARQIPSRAAASDSAK